MKRRLGLFTALVLAPAAFAQTPAQPSLLGSFEGFKAYTLEKNGARSCYVVGAPDRMAPANVRRDPVHLFVTHRPKDRVRNEINFQMGYPLKADAAATLEVGGSSYALATLNEGAWIAEVVKQEIAVEAMRKAKEITVKGTSVRGTATSDHYTLKGLAQALDRIDAECPK